jgi:GT2 family glycosyltransferase
VTGSPAATVGAVVLHYRNWPVVAETLRALQNQSRPPDHVVLVDNASGDGSASAIRAAFPDLTVLEVDRNDGYSAGMNAGVRVLPDDVDVLLLLTHECVLDRDALDTLVAELRADSRCGAVGPLLRLRSRAGAVWSAGGRLDVAPPRPWHMRDNVATDSDRGSAADWLDGAAVLVRANALRSVGGLDERYFLYYEDLDLCLRMQRAGYTVRCVSAAVGWQEPGHSAPYLDARNFPLVLRRNGHPVAGTVATLTHLAAGLRDLVRQDNRAMARARLVGTLHGVTGGLDRTLAAVRRQPPPAPRRRP